MRLELTIGALLLAAPATIAAAETPTAAEEAAIALAEQRGRLLYAYDQAAWHATDDLKARMPDFASRVAGWVVDGPVEAPVVTFYDANAAAPRAVYSATMRGRSATDVVVPAAGAGEPLNAARRALVEARTAAGQAFVAGKLERCARTPSNIVVLPPEQTGGATLVYLLAPQPDLNTIMMGGAYRVAVAPDGTTSGLRPFSRSCLAMPLNPPAKQGATPMGLVVSHLIDPTPTELHVFASLTAGKPVFVPIGSGRTAKVWIVDGARIRLPR